MRISISRKIGLGFFITFLLVIFLGVLSVFSLRHIYQGLDQVFSQDLPATRATYQFAISMEKNLSKLNNFLITGNENFKAGYERSYKETKEDLSALKKYVFEEEEELLLENIVVLVEDINELSTDVFGKRSEVKDLFNDLRSLAEKYRQRLDRLFDSEETKMLGEQDLLLVQAQYIPSSQLIMEVSSQFSNLSKEIAEYVTSEREIQAQDFMDEVLALDKSIRDYKNYYGYTISDKDRTLTDELIGLSGDMKDTVGEIVKVKEGVSSSLITLLAREKEFADSLDKLIALKKSGISSKVGVGAALTEDIPAIHNISKIEKDIAESWRQSARYMLTSDDMYKNTYYQLRRGIDKNIKGHERHARLRGTEKFLKDIVEADKDIVKIIASNMRMADVKNTNISDLALLKIELESGIDQILQYDESSIKNAQDLQTVLRKNVPARWAMMKLKRDLLNAVGLLVNYLSTPEAQYKDRYSEVYFDMKKYINRYRNFSTSSITLGYLEDLEVQLDRFNTVALEVFDNHDEILKAEGWTLIKLEETLKKTMDNAVEKEIIQIDENKSYIKNRVAIINAVIFLIIGIVAVIAVFVILYTINSITNPMRKLYEGAEIIGGGNLDHRLDIKTGDEIEDLAGGFNRMAGELKELYTNLENKVKERTLQLAEANKELEVKNKELDDFTYIVSHDLKEPLRGVKAFTKLLQEEYSGKVDTEGQEYLITIQDASTRMTALIEDLLNLSRIGRIKNIEPEVDLNALLSDVQKNLMYSLEEKKVDLKVSKDFPTVTCDKIRISEVFSNLISNAIKYCKKGVKPAVEVGYSDKGNMYEFFVKDNGIGIEKEYYDRVFQIFQRLHAKGEYEGTGAGLAIVKKIVENHGGKIWVTSKTGQGSTFYFTLPKKV